MAIFCIGYRAAQLPYEVLFAIFVVFIDVNTCIVAVFATGVECIAAALFAYDETTVDYRQVIHLVLLYILQGKVSALAGCILFHKQRTVVLHLEYKLAITLA